MDNRRVAVLFPGQGAYYAGALAESLQRHPQIADVFAAVDAVGAARLGVVVSEQIFRRDPPDIATLLRESPRALQLAIYGISVATYKILESQGLAPTTLIGHSFGEIAALVCAGAFSVHDGAEIVCHRMAALERLESSDGYMVAVGADASRTEKLVDLVGNHQVVIAGVNHDGQTVVSGATGAMDAVGQLARVLQIAAVRLDSPYPFHSPLMQPAVARFAASLRDVTQKPLRVPVFSPIEGRYYDAGDVLTDCLANHLVHPVRFAGAIQRVYRDGIRVFVESGALDTLGKLVKKIVPGSDVTTIACLDPRVGDSRSLMNAIDMLNHHGLLAGSDDAGLADVLLPGVDRATFDAFWADRASRVTSYIRAEYDAFIAKQAASDALRAVAPAMQAPTPVVIPDVKATTLSPATPPVPARGTDVPVATSRTAVLEELTTLYAEALEYPEEVFAEDVELEADLGVDSVKQTELLARVSERYDLPPRPPDFRLSDYHTLGKIADFVLALRPSAAPSLA